jgi:3-methylcrotonyl-CoA carboxylase beta subunit
VARSKHEQRGKLYVRERIERLVDPGTPFLELSALAGREMYGKDKVPAGGIVTGKRVPRGRQRGREEERALASYM